MAAAHEPDRETSAPRGRVLLVDDEETVLRSFARILRSAGFHVDTASDGQEAVRCFRTGQYHAVVSDISMPSMGGLELLKEIRKHDLDTPVVLVTGAPSVETAMVAIEQGAIRYLVKPVKTAELRHVVDQAVNLYRMALIKRSAMAALGDVDKQIGDRAGLEVKFESALEKLFMVYQPIIRFREREILGYETLVRTSEPAIPHPGALIDAAERLGRMRDLSRAIRAIAPRPMMEAPERGRLFYNLHVLDLDDEALYDSDSELARMAERVTLEMTERASLESISDPRSKISRLREMGFRIAVDDLGAGYAGLNSFAQLEPNVVKLDMALVRDVHLSDTKQKVIHSMNQLCSDMGMEVVAEGVETKEELHVLLELGCNIFQGYFFAKPGLPFVDPDFSRI